VVVAGGVEVMTRADGSVDGRRQSSAIRSVRAWSARYADQGGIVPQGISAELIADRVGHHLQAMDVRFAVAALALEAAGEVASTVRSSPCSVPMAGRC
jgi:acetyl-CoA acetyltransferase